MPAIAPHTGKITTGQAAALAEVSSQTIINWLDQKRFSFERIGSGPRKIDEREFRAYLESQGFTIRKG